LLIEYERTNSFADVEDATHLLKTKDVISMYPAITLYSLNKAIKDEKIRVVKIGNLNYFKKEDVERFLTSKYRGMYK
jgi:hypothetical protein